MCGHLQAMGHEVLLVTLVAGTDALPFAGRTECMDARLDHKWRDVAGWKRLAELIRSFAPDVVQANAADTLKYAVLSKRIFGWKQPLLYRNASVLSRYTRSALSKWVTGFLLHQVQGIISVSKASAYDLATVFRIPEKRITCIPVGIEPEAYRTDLLDGQPGFHLVHVGGFTFEKNHAGLIRIFQMLLVRLPEAKLWLVGDGPLRPQTEALVQELGLQQSVTFLGSRTDALSWIASADVLVLPSMMEGLPAVILEAFYTGTPVVAYAVGAIPEVLSERTGWPVKPDDAEGMANCIKQLVQDSATKRAERTQFANELVATTYQNAQVVQQFIQQYESFLCRR